MLKIDCVNGNVVGLNLKLIESFEYSEKDKIVVFKSANRAYLFTYADILIDPNVFKITEEQFNWLVTHPKL